MLIVNRGDNVGISALYALAGLVVSASPLRRLPRLTCTWLALISAGAILQVEMLLRFGGMVDVNALALVSETTSGEALPLLHSVPARLLLGWGLIVVIWGGLMLWPPQLLRWPGRRLALFGGGVCAALLAIVVAFEGLHETPVDAAFDQPSLERIEALRRGYPTGMLLVIWEYFRQRRELVAADAGLENFRFGASRSVVGGGPRRVHVLVIGETGRADHWALNGYSRDSTPRLSRRNDLISFTRFYSRATFTRLSVPVILSRKPPGSVEATFGERSLLQAAREAGYHTVWLSNQAPMGFHDSPITVLAKDADELRFISPVDYRHAGVRDEDLLPHVRRLLAADQRDLFLVIHTMGSHFRYRDRYRPEDAVFQPDKPEHGDVSLYDPDHKEYLVNGYDNSIRATDRFLDGLIGQLGKLNAASWMFYVADHGEALFDDCRAESGHGQSSPATHHVAAVWWGSEAYLKYAPEAVRNLRANAGAMLSTSMVFDTTTRLAGVDVPGYRQSHDFSSAEPGIPRDIALLPLDVPRCQ
ncbi:phosphoethanolamine transferase [Xanthomonas nasturtii]|uniref:phosphoethanolamine transferase n=1 Tax=Xanthomonas nasturtii TaxID=1843581 RepID=UPI002011E3E2|nr:phosphoethanolamine transferase [Xanthomonas nasturtii]MCL1536007.1 phosphoethanolamine transferase [Xanthomonas nasturtii]MCL1545363.1 phosphoethanolamine transferase [Xanthomonas nasturtii]